MNYIEALQKRYSVKKFDKEQKVPQEKVENIIEAARLSASSLGLQPYRLMVLHTEEMLEKVAPAFFNPSQVSTCSHLVFVITQKELEDSYIQSFLENVAQTRNMQMENLAPFQKIIFDFREMKRPDGFLHWNEKQSYLLLGHLLVAAALENIDTCPMEGFIKEKLYDTLGVDPAQEEVSVALALGMRAEDDFFQTMKKVRKPQEKFVKYL